MLQWANGAGRDLMQRPDWERHAGREWERSLRTHGGAGAFESAETCERRVEGELQEARRLLAEKTGAKADVLCWPENAFTEVGERVARRVGHVATVSNRHASRNRVGEAPDRIVRVFIGSHALGFRHAGADFASFVLELKVMEGWYLWYPPLAAMHLAKKTVGAARRRWRWNGDYLSAWE
jgi:hypothetical protein